MDRVKFFLLRTGVGSEVHHKEQYIPRDELEGEPSRDSWRAAGG